MNRALLFFATVLTVCGAYAVAPKSEFSWPIPGKAGDGVLFTPQNYIDGELNFGNLFLTAREGTPVCSPVDGVVGSFSLVYAYSLDYQISSGVDPGDDIPARIRAFASELNAKDDPRYISLALGIYLQDGRTLYIHGLHGEQVFRTGEKIRRGQPLGTMGYSYLKIPEPSIQISISDPRTRPDDPMTPFGLKTTFLPPTEIPVITSLTGEQVRADFTALMDALREAYPGLHDAVTPEELEAFCAQTLAAFPAKMEIRAFYAVLKRVVSKLHDSHIYLYPMERDRQRRSLDVPQIYFGWIDSTLVATRCTAPYAAYYGRRIRSVDSIPADSLRRLIAGYVDGYDARVKSYNDWSLALAATRLYSDFAPGASRKCDAVLEFEDGERLSLKGWTYRGGDTHGLAPDITGFIRTNRYPEANFSLKVLNDSTAYLGLSTFQLNQVEVDSLAGFIRSVADKPNLIIDVRNNGGGDVKVLSKLLSFFATKPFAVLGGYMTVRKQGGFQSFKHCMNYSPEQTIFADFVPVEGQQGFYSYEDTEQILPDSTTCYKGRLYVLTDAGSCSAATVFPATILRNHRGVIVGRETATAYHFMNALKFADIRLPNSWLTVRVPLVRCVFDVTENPRIPYGRGVIPDHQIDLTLDEIASVRGDSILNYTLALIDRGEYLGEDPFAATDASVSRGWLWGVVAGVVLFGAAIVVTARRRAKK